MSSRILCLRADGILDRRRVGDPGLGVDCSGLSIGNERRPSLVEPDCALKGVAGAQDTGIIKWPTGNLHGERKATIREAAENRQRWPTGTIEGRSQIWPLPECKDIVSVEAASGR